MNKHFSYQLLSFSIGGSVFGMWISFYRPVSAVEWLLFVVGILLCAGVVTYVERKAQAKKATKAIFKVLNDVITTELKEHFNSIDDIDSFFKKMEKAFPNASKVIGADKYNLFAEKFDQAKNIKDTFLGNFKDYLSKKESNLKFSMTKSTYYMGTALEELYIAYKDLPDKVISE